MNPIGPIAVVAIHGIVLWSGQRGDAVEIFRIGYFGAGDRPDRGYLCQRHRSLGTSRVMSAVADFTPVLTSARHFRNRSTFSSSVYSMVPHRPFVH